MRSTTAPELAILAAATRRVTYRVKVANGSGTMIDLSSWVESISRNEDVDQPVAGATVSFTRANGVLQTLSPLRTDSTLNRLDDLVTYGPQLDLVRSITIEVATTAIGVAPVAGDYKLKFKGRTATVSFGSNPIVVECRDEGGVLVDRWVETKKLYGSGPGVAVETVMQSIHDDVFGAGVVPVWTPTSPSYLVSPAFQQQYQSVMDADVALAQLPGWDVRYKWDDGTGAFRFKFYAPDRTKTVPDFTFGPAAYFDVSTLELSELDIRNVVIVEYKDVADLGNRKTIVVSDSASIAKYGRRPLFIIESDDSPINTSAEATTMGNAALADMKDPKAEFEITAPFCWPLELGDLDRFLPNAVHFDTNQDWAIVSITDELSPGRHETKIRVRGKPLGQYITWLGRGQTIGGPVGGTGQAYAPYPFITPLNTEANELSWNLRFSAVLGSGGGGTNLTYTVKRKKDFASETTLDSGNASAFPKDLTVTRDPKQNAVLTFTVTDAATGMVAIETYLIPAYNPFIDSTGGTITSGTNESGGKAINRFHAKPLSSDPDVLDSIVDGTTYKKIVSVSGGKVTSGSIGALAVTDAAVNDAAAGKLTAGTLVSGILESGGKAINRVFAKALAGDPDTLDSAADGTTYKKVVSVSGGQVTTASIANNNVTKDKTEVRHRCSLIHSTTQAISNNTLTRVAFDSELYDTGLHDNVTNNSRITVPAGGDVGTWTLIAGVTWQTSFGTTGYTALRIIKNNTGDLVPGDYRPVFNDATFGPVQPLVGIDPNPSVGDFYEVFVRHTAGASRNITADIRFQAIHSW